MVVRWIITIRAARYGGKQVSVKLTVPFNFNIDDGTSGGYTLLWGQLKGKAVEKNEVLSCIEKPVMVRDGAGNEVEVNELLIERERDGKFTDAQSNGKFTPDQIKIVKKLKSGDRLSVTTTVQRGGVFYYVTKDYLIQWKKYAFAKNSHNLCQYLRHLELGFSRIIKDLEDILAN